MLHLRLSQVDFFLLPDFFLESTDHRFFEIASKVQNPNRLNGIVSRKDFAEVAKKYMEEVKNVLLLM